MSTYFRTGQYPDYQAATEAVKIAIYKYNNKRPHRSVDLMFPSDAHLQEGVLKKHWKKRKYLAKQKSGITEQTVITNQD